MIKNRHELPYTADLLLRVIETHGPIRGRDLAALFRIDERQLRGRMQRLRKLMKGGTIVAGSSGYYVCEDREEIDRRTRTLISHAIGELVGARVMRRAMDLDQVEIDRLLAEAWEPTRSHEEIRRNKGAA